MRDEGRVVDAFQRRAGYSPPLSAPVLEEGDANAVGHDGAVHHPSEESGVASSDRDYAMMLSEWKIEVGTRRPDPNEMTDFNVFTMNGRSFPGTQALVAKIGERVRIRIGNLSTMSHHSIHLHGYYFKVVATDGGEIPEAGQWPETTVHMPTGSTRTVEFVANAPGDWVIHCHMLHHVMTQMGHRFGNIIDINTEGLNQKIRKLVPGYMTMGQDGMGEMGDMGMAVPPNSLPMVGVQGQHDYITMGGMFTLLKVREELPADGSDPGWYKSPPGTQAEAAPDVDLKRDGIELPKDLPKTAARRKSKDDVWCGVPPAKPTLLAKNEINGRIKLH